MYRIKVKLLALASVMILALPGCEDNMFQRDQQTIGGKTIGGGGYDGPGDLTENPDGRYPYPEIIEQEYIPSYDLFAHTKCLAWRITWPEYAGNYDTDLIPTVFSRQTGLVNSFNFLNNTSAQNTYKGNFSLYYGNKVESANTMWTELDYSFGAGGNMETAYFAHSDMPLKNIMDWVMERPSLFKSYWPGSSDNELDYEEGDFIQFKLAVSNNDNDSLYGGIRIVSMTPRIVEVYLAVPNL
jgi:hypothetical protein